MFTFSLGGYIVREFLVNHAEKEFLKNLKLLIFAACPLQIPSMRSQVMEKLEKIIPSLHYFMSPTHFCSISSHEYNEHFIRTSFILSKISREIEENSKEKIQELNNKFLSLNLNYDCWLES